MWRWFFRRCSNLLAEVVAKLAEFISVVGGEGYYRIWLFHLGNDHYVFFNVVEPAALPAVDGLYYIW